MLERRILENILILKLNHKPVNQLDLAMLKALNREIKEFQSSSMRGLILQSESKKIFSAGLDLKTLLMKDSGPLLFRETILNLMSEFQTLVYNILSTPQPTLSLIEGFAPAGGTVLALATDYRVGSSMGFSMGLNEVKVGMAPPKWVHSLFSNVVGSRNSNLHLQQGTMFNKQESLRIGLVDEVIEENQLLDRGFNWVRETANLPWFARVDTKRMLNKCVIDDMNNYGLERVVDCIAGNEFQITAQSILESRKK